MKLNKLMLAIVGVFATTISMAQTIPPLTFQPIWNPPPLTFQPINSVSAPIQYEVQTEMLANKSAMTVGKFGIGLNTSDIYGSNDSRDKGGVIEFTTTGNRYLGSDVLSAGAWYNLDEDQQIAFSVSKGLQLRDSSKGGDFYNGSAIYKKAHKFGVASIGLDHTSYKVGGEYEGVGLSGNINTISLGNDIFFSEKLVGSVGLVHRNSKEDLKINNSYNEQDYSYMTVRGIYLDNVGSIIYSVDINYEKGLGGNNINNPYFDSLKGDLVTNYEFNNGMSWVGTAGFQKSSNDTPSANLFYMGGNTRGSAYSTGLTSVPNGVYVSNSLIFNQVDIGNSYIVPFIGYNYAYGEFANGKNITLQSAFVGFDYKPSMDSNLNLNYSKEINAYDNVPTNRLKMTLTIDF